MTERRASAAFPLLTLFLALALMFVAIRQEAPGWVELLILAAWWAGFYFWYKRNRYRM